MGRDIGTIVDTTLKYGIHISDIAEVKCLITFIITQLHNCVGIFTGSNNHQVINEGTSHSQKNGGELNLATSV